MAERTSPSLTGSGVVHYAKAGQVGDRFIQGDPVEALCGVRFTLGRAPGLPVCEGCDAEFSSAWPSSGDTNPRHTTGRRSFRSTGIAGGTAGSGFGLAD